MKPVSLLVTQAKRVTLSNMQLFITDEFLVREVKDGFKASELQHVMCHSRNCFMISNKEEDLNKAFNVRLDGYNYILFASSKNFSNVVKMAI